MRKAFLCVLLVAFAWQAAATAQTTIFRQGDRVVTSDGRAGVIEAFKNQELAKVKFDDGSTEYFMLTTLKKFAAENFKVGDTVYAKQTGQRGTIEALDGSVAKVRFGAGKYDFKNMPVSMLMNEAAGSKAREREEDEIKQKPLRAAFEDEAKPFHSVVYFFAWAYKSQFRMNGGRIPQDPAEIAEMRKSLEGLAAVCQKYPHMTNPPGVDDHVYAGDINLHPADWCGMAEQRDAVMKKVLGAAGDIRARDNIGIWENAIREAMRDPNGYVKDGVQQLVFDRTAWQQKELKGVQEAYTKAGEQIPAELLAPLFKQADELKAKIEQDAAARGWKQPAYKDAALEGLVRAAYPKQFPGVQLLKTGMTYATWKAYDDTSLVSSYSEYKVYRVDRDKYRQKDGLALARLPNQTLCQIRNFTLEQVRNGAAFGAAHVAGIGRGGIFVKCP